MRNLTIGTTGSSPLLLHGHLLSHFSDHVRRRATSLGRVYSPLFPNLRSLACEIIMGNKVMSCTPLLFGPSLTELVFRVTTSLLEVRLSTESLAKVLLQVLDVAPLLHSLKFERGPDAETPTGLSEELSAALCKFSVDRLKTLQVDFTVSSAALLHVASGTKLEDVRLFVGRLSDDKDTLPEGSLAFPVLKRLMIVSVDIQQTKTFVNALQVKALERLDVVFSSGWTGANMQELCTSIGRQRQLRQLRMVFAGQRDLKSPQFVFMESLAPLLELHELRLFVLEGNVLATVDNLDLRKVGHAWRNLRVLVLNGGSGPIDESARLPPLVTLREIQISFPHLGILRLALDTKVSALDLVACRQSSPMTADDPLAYLSICNGPFRSLPPSADTGFAPEDIIRPRDLFNMVLKHYPCLKAFYYPTEDARWAKWLCSEVPELKDELPVPA